MRKLYLIISLIIAVSLIINVLLGLYFGNRWWQTKQNNLRLEGSRTIVAQIIQIVERSGQLIITKDDGEQIKLIKQ